MAGVVRDVSSPNRLARWVALSVVAIFVAAACHTYTLYDETADEGQHIAVGMEWFFRHSSSLDPLTPPLAPAVTAVGPILLGVRPPAEADLWTKYDAEAVGEKLLSGPRFRRTLYAARASTLVFYLLTVAWLWYRVRDWMGEAWAAVVIAVFSLCPSVLTHGSLANTDVATMAMLTWALDRLWVLGRQPTRRNAIVAGVVVGLGFLTKFTMGPFLMASAATMLILSWFLFRRHASRFRRLRPRIGLATIVVFAVVVWAGYFLSVGKISDSDGGEARFASRLQARPLLAKVAIEMADHVPAPVLVRGIRYFKVVSRADDRSGTYFCGRLRFGKMWYFFPVMFAVKMPIPFILLTLAGGALAAMLLWQRREPYLLLVLAGIVGPFAIGIQSSVHAGLRHILAVAPFCSVLVALAIHAMWSASRFRVALRSLVVALLFWQAAEFCTALPDPLPWYNEAVHGNGDWVGGGTDYDYGQDLKRLGERLRELHVSKISLLYYPRPDPAREGITAQPLQPYVVTHGWIAIGGLMVQGLPEYQWLRGYKPVSRAGNMNIYYIP